MKSLACGLILGFLLITTNCWADFTYKELLHAYEMSDENQTQGLDNYLLGLYEGINAANLGYYMQTKESQYCKSPDFDLNIQDIKKIIEDTHNQFDVKGDIPVSFLLFVGLKQTFPCL